ncbi:nuclear transport factor 2 family protein [Agromyces sp. MMS24-JH15]|uniref:nuclear transport factor 2 family protein n=1 Tax=Agromyces sp. MMS24-JH15 TaxID=3243765 RepID=UPI003749B487
MSTVIERLTEAQNDHDAVRLSACFAVDYRSEQPAHPARAFTGRAQVLANWTAVFAGVPDFRAEIRSTCRVGDVEWGELAWRGHHVDGSPFAMCGVIVAEVRDDLIASARLYFEPVERDSDIEASVARLYRPPR